MKANMLQIWDLAWNTVLSSEYFSILRLRNQYIWRFVPRQSFVGGIVAFKALPRPQFSSLQQKIFPVYFGIQTVLPVVLALTYPGTPGAPSSLSGTFAEPNRWSVLVPVATMFVTSFFNMTIIGPATTRVMKERKHQGKPIKSPRIYLLTDVSLKKLGMGRRAMKMVLFTILKMVKRTVVK